MFTRRAFKPFAILVIVATLLLPAQGAGAVTYEYIDGGVNFTYTWFESDRYIVDPSSPGAEVAFLYDSGPSDLELGVWNCEQKSLYWGRYPQTLGEWNDVANGLGSGQKFCLVSRADSGNGHFWGTLGWD